MWGKKKVRHDKTKKPMKKYYVKSADKHYIWVKWKNAFQDKPDIVWSAEPQGKHYGYAQIVVGRVALESNFDFHRPSVS